MSRVLVVDDEPRVLRALSEGLNGRHDVSTSSSAGEARDRMENSEPFDAIIADQVMPVEFGHELLAWARDYQPHCERFLLTGTPITPDLCDNLKDAGNVRIFPKPWNLDKLSGELDKCLKVQAPLESKTEEPAEAPKRELKTAFRVSERSKQTVVNRLIAYENSSANIDMYSKFLLPHYDQLVVLDEQGKPEDRAVGYYSLNTEMIYNLEEVSQKSLSQLKRIVEQYRPQHVLLTITPAVGLQLKSIKLDPTVFSVLVRPFSIFRLRNELKLL